MLFRVFIGAVILASGSVEATATTTAESAPHAYDAPTISRVGVEALGTDAAASALLGGEGDQSSSLSVVGSGTSTTPTHLLNATNTAGEAATTSGSLVPYEAYPPKSLADHGFLVSWRRVCGLGVGGVRLR